MLLDLRTMVPVDAVESLRVPSPGPPPVRVARRLARRRGSAFNTHGDAPSSASYGDGDGDGADSAGAYAGPLCQETEMHGDGYFDCTCGADCTCVACAATVTVPVLVPARKCTDGPWTAKRSIAGTAATGAGACVAGTSEHGTSAGASDRRDAVDCRGVGDQDESLIYGSMCSTLLRYPVTTWPPPTELERRMSSIKDYSRILDVELYT